MTRISLGRRSCRCRRCRTRGAWRRRHRRCRGRRSCPRRGRWRCRRPARRRPARRRWRRARSTPAMAAAASTMGLRRPSGVGVTMISSRYAGHFRGNGVHQHRRRVGGLAAGHVQAHAVQWRDFLPEHACRRLAVYVQEGSLALAGGPGVWPRCLGALRWVGVHALARRLPARRAGRRAASGQRRVPAGPRDLESVRRSRPARGRNGGCIRAARRRPAGARRPGCRRPRGRWTSSSLGLEGQQLGTGRRQKQASRESRRLMRHGRRHQFRRGSVEAPIARARWQARGLQLLRALGFQGGLVDDQARGDGHLRPPRPPGRWRATGRRWRPYRRCQSASPIEGGELHRAVQLD